MKNKSAILGIISLIVLSPIAGCGTQQNNKEGAGAAGSNAQQISSDSLEGNWVSERCTFAGNGQTSAEVFQVDDSGAYLYADRLFNDSSCNGNAANMGFPSETGTLRVDKLSDGTKYIEFTVGGAVTYFVRYEISGNTLRMSNYVFGNKEDVRNQEFSFVFYKHGTARPAKTYY